MSLRPAILLDRDGTIIVEREYLADPTLAELEEGAARGLRKLADAGWPFVVLTNQSGIARGYFDHAAADAVNARVADLLAAEGVSIAGWFICPHGPDDKCACRKPAPGMALEAADLLGLDLRRSWMIGDKRSDVELATHIGAEGILVMTGHSAAEVDWARSHGIVTAATLEDAADHILAASPCRSITQEQQPPA